MRKKSVVAKIFCFLASAALIFTSAAVPCSAESPLSVSAESAVLIDSATREVLYEKNAKKRRPMASTTKIMTALIALENCDLDKTVCVSPSAVGIEGSSVYLYAQEKLSMEALVYALMLESANDAAVAIAIEVAGSVEDFAAMMNAKAADLGLHDTHFANPHGLDAPDHYTTAYDLAILTAYALENPTFRQIVSTYKKVISQGENDNARLLLNHNKFLKQYSGAIGVKTGYTKKSGRCLVSAAERDGMTLVAVTLSAPDDWNDHAAMLDYGFAHFQSILLAGKNELNLNIPVVGGKIQFVTGTNYDSARICLPAEHVDITRILELKRFCFAPVKEGDLLGWAVYQNMGETIARLPIYAVFGVEKARGKSIFERFTELFK